MSGEISDHAISTNTPQGVPSRFQFSLRALFAIITLSAIWLAVIPKNNVGIVSFFFVPQFGLATWIVCRRYWPAHGDIGIRLPRSTLIVSLSLALALPIVFVAALLGCLPSDNFAGTILLGTLATSPAMLAFHVTRKGGQARMLLSLLHGYNMLASFVIAFLFWYIWTFVGFE